MNILVTGPNGFLGTHFVKQMKHIGHDVYRLSYRDNIQKDSFIAQEILKFKPRVTVHFAWWGGSNSEYVNDVKQFKNVSNSIKLLEILGRLDTPHRFVGIGTAAEYGARRNINYKVSEELQEEPESLYGIAKLTLKNYSHLYTQLNLTEWTWVRPMYVYGPGDVKTRFIPSLIEKFSKNQDVIMDEGTSKIDYLYVDDFVDALSKVVDAKLDGVYNICSGLEYRLCDIVLKIKEEMRSKSKIVFDPALNNLKPSSVCGENTKLRTAISWQPRIPFEDGLESTLKYMEHKREIYEGSGQNK